MIQSKLGKRKILVAEDIELNQQIVKHIIQSWGCEVTIATNGAQALHCITRNNYDLVLMDIQMPEMDGIQATLQIRSLPDKTKASIPIIAFTAHSLKEDSAKYLAAGMNDYLSKPFVEEKLYEMIAKYLLPVSDILEIMPEESPTPNSDPTEKLYDLSLIEAVSGGDTDFIRKMVDLFVETVPPNVRELNAYHAQQDWDGVNKVAHKLKSTLDSMGIQSIKQDIRTIEQSAKSRQNLDLVPTLMHKVTTTVDACIKQLEREMVDL
ncbi:MAG: response regulator [Williamsia sp.]|nr:response regulator [Williamsia sp.]